MRHTRKWFINRIGKRIFRDWFKCCKTCDDVARNGIVVADRQHAIYLFDCQNEMPIKYRNKK